MTTQEIYQQAYKIGYETRKNGGSVVPAQSSKLMALIEESKLVVGELNPIFVRFSNGFHACGLDVLLEKQKQMQAA